MHSRKWNKGGRILAGIMALVMVLGSAPTSSVYADEGTDSSTPEVSETAPDNSGAASDTSKIDVWDFGAEVLDTAIYNNLLDADTINSWTTDKEAGSTGANITSFTCGDLSFNDGGYPGTHRYRTTNKNLTRYDEKSLKDTDGNVYTGYIYSNKSSTDTVNFTIKASAGDKITVVAASNGKDSDVTLRSESKDEQFYTHTLGSSTASIHTFYAATDGTYTLYSSNEKLVVARIYREHAAKVSVSGNAEESTGALSDYSIVFTNRDTNAETEATVSDGAYSATLLDGYTYDVSLKNANGYIITGDQKLTINKGSGSIAFDVTIAHVTTASVSGQITGLSDEALEKAVIRFVSDKTYQPDFTRDGASYTAQLEYNTDYSVEVTGINDYALVSPETLNIEADADVNLVFEAKPRYAVTLALSGASSDELAGAVFTFTNLNEEGYSYSFTGTEGITLRDGVYSVTVSNTGDYTQALTSNLKVNGADVTKSITFKKVEAAASIAYKETITVGEKDCDYTTVNDALDAVRSMDRTSDQRVTISIEPGNYEEMLVVDVPNVTLKNASETPSTDLLNKGVDIADNAVRITSYYGHGYTYYSMGSDCKWDAETLAVNKENGYASFENPGSGTTSGSYWNATVVITDAASGFEAEGIIFENSFNQYVSKKASEDVIVAQSGAKENASAPRAGLEEGSTAVQDKAYVERAAALAIYNNVSQVSFDNCKFIGRQDTLYGGTGTTAAFYNCSIYGGTDYIFGGMTAVFAKCDLVFNTSDSANDVGYITAAQQKSGRGYLMYNCTVTSTTPGVDTASTYTSKAGYFGRPWQANTSEVVFYDTIIDALDSHWSTESASLIAQVGWLSTLGGTSNYCFEYGTCEKASNVDNSTGRASWSTVLSEPVLSDGTAISVEAFLGSWDAFAGKDMTITLPDGNRDNTTGTDESGTTTPDNGDNGTSTPDTGDNNSSNHATAATTIYTLDTTAGLTAFAQGAKADGDSEKAGTDNYFTLLYSAKTKVDSSSKTFDDGYSATQRVNFGGVATTEKNAIKFTTSGAATVKVYWAEGGDDNRQIMILDSTGTEVAATSETLAKNAVCISTLSLTDAGTYYLGSKINNNYIFKVVVTETSGTTETAPRADWSTVAAPEITAAAVSADNANQIDVTVKASVGYDGADKVTVTMTDENGNVVDSKSSSAEKDEHTVSFTPSASGTYTFTAKAVREDETDKTGTEGKTVSFTLPLTAPSIKSATNTGNGSVEVKWEAVTEADSYTVTVDGTEIQVVTSDLTAVVDGLTAGSAYTISVAAVRGTVVGASASISVTVKADAEVEWAFSAYGSSVNTKNNGYTGNANDGTVTVYSESGKGKIVPGSTDGLAYYYTTIDPETENFTLTADIHVDNWTLSNGQEGFGLMVSDTVGPNGDGTAFWNNCFQAIATKTEYYYDGEAVTTDTSASKITMKLGIGTIAKTGVTADDVAAIKAGTITMPENFSTVSGTLESSCAANGAGTYNIIGNYVGAEPTGTQSSLMTDFKLSITRNNTGYILRAYDTEGNLLGEQLYYDLERNALTQIDADHIYVGFFASRNARITASNISLTKINPNDDAAAEEREIEYVYPNYVVNSASTANSKDYSLVFRSNADGVLIVSDKDGNEVYTSSSVKANTNVTVPTELALGNNTFNVTFTPDADYVPGEYQKLTSYDTVTFTHTVSYKIYGTSGSALYVSPDGSSSGDGTKEQPLDIYTAVKYVQAGQTIVLMEGTYNLSKTVKVERGINGTADAFIYMVADPEASTRPVFDFGSKCAGMILAGDYWYFQGFDVTRSADAQKGIQVSGDHNTLDQIETYKNGNTGLQISRYLTSDEYEDWPSYNLILNCSSYENADKGYEDADGFAAKLTVGDGNVFDGCISHHNADDGWDLFAKVQTGSIGSVTIQNCVAYLNGYVTGSDGKLIDAGNGNGFKMGGDSMSGYHVLKNSIAFANKAKGIDSNSCPDIQVYNSVSYNNESFNVAFYTNTAVNTDYKADGVISYRTESTGTAEQIKPLGTQDTSKIYGSTNYYWDSSKKVSANSDGATVSADWFVSLDFTTIDRNADGTINTHGFLMLSDKAACGESLGGTPSAVITIPGATDGTVEDGETPETGDNGADMPETGDNGADVPETGDNSGNAPETGDNSSDVPETGDNGSGATDNTASGSQGTNGSTSNSTSGTENNTQTTGSQNSQTSTTVKPETVTTDTTASSGENAAVDTENKATTGTTSKKSIKKASVSKIATQLYTGKKLTPSVTVKLGSTTLKAGRDYTVSYKNNKDAGTATVTIKGTGSYKGTVTTTFTISKKLSGVKTETTAAGNAKISWKKVSGAEGYAIYRASKKNGTYKKLTTTSGTSYTDSSLKAGKTYYYKVRAYKTVKGKKVYGSWSAVKSVKLP